MLPARICPKLMGVGRAQLANVPSCRNNIATVCRAKYVKPAFRLLNRANMVNLINARGSNTLRFGRFYSAATFTREGSNVPKVTISDASISSIQITETERKVFDLIMTIASQFRQQAPTLRIAGGWVRDKILGNESIDIDVALDTVTGVAFCKALQRYFASIPEDQSPISTNIGTTKFNPEQSKHLETAIIHIYGIEVNFVQLRSDEYASHSRIPTIRNATPLEDALRRDLTINTLFYNLNTDTVEDFTGRGISDLQQRIIATPLAPQETLSDDPLRALRVVRFAARFNFSIEKALDEELIRFGPRGISSKISRERIGTEVAKMLQGANPERAIELLTKYKLHHCIIRFNDDEPAPTWSEDDDMIARANALAAIRILRHTKVRLSEADKELAGFIMLALAYKMVPPPRNPLVNQEMLDTHALEYLMKVALKWTNRASLISRLALERSWEYSVLHKDLVRKGVTYGVGERDLSLLIDSLEPSDFASNQNELILWIRKSGQLWPAMLLFAALRCMGPSGAAASNFEREFQHYSIIVNAIWSSRLVKVLEIKPLLDGFEIQQLAGIKKPGKLVGWYFGELSNWHAHHLDATKTEALSFAKSLSPPEGLI